MEMDQFDTFTRTLITAGSSRRQTLRALGSLFLGGTLGNVAARRGLVENAEAKPEKHQKDKAGRQRKPDAERKGHGQLQAAGKKHKRHKHNHHDKPKERQDPPQLCDVLCEEQGGRCCPDGGGCAEQGQCCPGEQKCADGFCYDPQFCCPEERRCTVDRSCIPVDQCCPDERRCPDGECMINEVCCNDERMCADGTCIPMGECCPEEKLCGGECIAKNECCQLSYPLCDRGCNFIQCVDGEWECHPRPFGDYCLMPWYDPGICCKGECRPRDYCERDGGHYDPDTCICIKQ